VSLVLSAASGRESIFTATKTEEENDVSPWRMKMRYFMSHPRYMMVFNMLIIFSLFQFAIADYFSQGTSGNKYIKSVLIGAIVNNFIFLLDIIFHLAAFGFKRLFRNKK
jgi:hypothetical protein